MLAINQKIVTEKGYRLFLKREELLHPEISGNKFRKLKYQLEDIQSKNITTILTFGGAFSNHIAAVAAAGKKYHIKTIGIIRGEELKEKISENPTLNYARKQGMQLEFISREIYRQKDDDMFVAQLKLKFGNFYLIPEGGTNALAVKGCAEIITGKDQVFDYICVPVGTGGTMAGIVKSLAPNQFVLGFSALQGTFQKKIIDNYTNNKNYNIIDTYNFGGYAKIDTELVRFMNNFKQKHNILLDPVYTGKMMYGIFDLMEKEYFNKNSRILAVHTGGLQGIAGMNLNLKRKKLPVIHV